MRGYDLDLLFIERNSKNPKFITQEHVTPGEPTQILTSRSQRVPSENRMSKTVRMSRFYSQTAFLIVLNTMLRARTNRLKLRKKTK